LKGRVDPAAEGNPRASTTQKKPTPLLSEPKIWKKTWESVESGYPLKKSTKLPKVCRHNWLSNLPGASLA